jgi:hypothetical protein
MLYTAAAFWIALTLTLLAYVANREQLHLRGHARGRRMADCLDWRSAPLGLVVMPCRFPPPWSVENPNPKLERQCFIVRDADERGAAP